MKKWILGLLALVSVTALADGPIQNEDVKGLADIEAAVLSTTGNLTSSNHCISSPGSTAGLSVGVFIYDQTSPAKIPAGTTVAGLPGSCSAGQIQMSANATASATGDTITFGGQASQLVGDDKIYVKANSINQTLSSAIQGGLIGGGGSGAGINLLQDPGFETGIATYWSNSGGTFAAVSSGSNLLIGRGSATFQASGSGQYAKSLGYAIQNGMAGGNCTASMLYSGGDSNLYFEVTDGTNVLDSAQLQPAASAQTVTLNFQCPAATTNVDVRVVSIASSALIAMDQMFLGQGIGAARVGQATLYGTVFLPVGGALYSNGGSPILSQGYQFTVSSGTPSSPVITGNISSFDGTTGGITMNNLPPGNYLVVYQGGFRNNDATLHTLWLTDGTSLQNGSVGIGQPTGSSNYVYTPSVQGMFQYSTPQSSVTIFPFASQSNTVFWNNIDLNANIYVYRFPSQEETLVTPDTINWRVQAVNSSTTNVSIPAGALTEITYPAGNTIGNYGTVAALQTCSPSEAPNASTCSGSNDLGISFNVPVAGAIHVCAEFSQEQANNGSGGSTYYAITRTPLTSLSVLDQQVNYPSFTGNTSSGTIQTGAPFNTCWDFNIASAGPVAFRLFSSSNGVSVNQQIVPQNNAAVKWTVYPITQNVPAPVFLPPAAFHVSGVPSGSPGSSAVAIAIFPKSGPEDFDTSSGYNVSTGFFTIPPGGTGLWQFTCQLVIESTTTVSQGWQYDAYICKNSNSICTTGTQLSIAQQWYTGSSPDNIPGDPIGTVMAFMKTGDTVACYGELNANPSWGGGYADNYFEGHMVH